MGTIRDIILYGGAIVLGAYAITRIIPSASSAQCTTSGSPCYSALQPLIQEFQACATQYNSILSTCYKSGTPSTCLTQNQSELDQLKACMDSMSTKIAATAKQFSTDPFATLLGSLQIPIETAVVIYFGSRAVGYLRGLKSQAKTGSEAANNMLNATTREEVDVGTISGTEASNMADSIKTNYDSNVQTNTSTYNTMASEESITFDEATTASLDAESTMGEDATVTVDDWLVGVEG